MVCDALESLQAEFCPPLDTALLAALLADVDPAAPQLDPLRATLRELADHASAHHEHELAAAESTTACSTTSDSSAVSRQSFSSPLGFLQAALPHIPPFRLRRALAHPDAAGHADLDMEAVVEALLTDEYIRELEERGLDALGDTSAFDSDPTWKRVETKKTPAKRKHTRGRTITLVDVRQQQHLPPPKPAGPPPPDPWTQLSSLSEHLATLLPPHPASFFQSHFHSPTHLSPAHALRAALSSIAGTQAQSPAGASPTATLFTMLDVLRDSPTCAALDAEQRSVLYADAQLALRATHGRGDDAIDIVWLLLELELDLQSGTLAMGVYHLPQSPLSPTPSSPWISPTSPSPITSRDRSASTSAATRQLPTGPPPVLPPPTSKRKSASTVSSPPTSPTATKPHPFQWQTVPQKPPKSLHPLAVHIPAYNSANQNRRSSGIATVPRGTGNGTAKSDVDELAQANLRQRIATSLGKRDELLREASKAWRRGNARTRGGEVALYFAERAREYQELARREALNEARIMVDSKRSAAADRNTIDLHGTSISEAIVIVRDILHQEGCSPANPLRIITGRGMHSASGVSVLKPAVRNALVQDGWNVGLWDGGLVVRGRSLAS